MNSSISHSYSTQRSSEEIWQQIKVKEALIEKVQKDQWHQWVCQMLDRLCQKILFQLNTGNQPIRMLLRQQLKEIWSDLRDQCGVLIDKPIHLAEVNIKQNLLIHLAVMVIIQDKPSQLVLLSKKIETSSCLLEQPRWPIIFQDTMVLYLMLILTRMPLNNQKVKA